MLDILMPAARICELRKQGNRIDTVRVMRPTEEGKLHSVALYVLQGEVRHEKRNMGTPANALQSICSPWYKC